MIVEKVCTECGHTYDIDPGDMSGVCWNCWRKSMGVCDFCGASPASDYTSRIPPHETVSFCYDCFEYEHSRFDGF
jgi:hypothetical protein